MKENINKEFGLTFGNRVVFKVGSNILAGNDDGVNSNNMKNIKLVGKLNY